MAEIVQEQKEPSIIFATDMIVEGDGDNVRRGSFSRPQRRSSFNSSRRASMLIAEDKSQIPVTIIGPDDAEITLDDIAVAPDGGWGWAVVFGAFMCNLMVDGITFSFGIMQDEIVKSSSPIESERVAVSTVAWIGSLLFGFTLISGPIVSSLANKFGFRAVAMAGSIVSSASFATAWAFTDQETGEANMAVMFLVYGVIGGIGFSLIYVPAVITVGFYFEKKRAFATGIAICGSGCGTFVFAPLSAYLTKEFGWHNALLVQAGLLFACLIFAALFRPLLPLNQSRHEFEAFEQDATHTPLLMRIKRARDCDMEKWDSVISFNSKEGISGTSPMLLSERKRRITVSSFSQSLNSNATVPETRKISLPVLLQQQNQPAPAPVEPLNLSLHHIEEEAEHDDHEGVKEPYLRLDAGVNTPTPSNAAEAAMDEQEPEKRRFTAESRRSRNFSTTENPFRRRKASVTLMLSNSALITAEMTQSKILRIQNKSVLNKPMHRDDIFLAASLQAAPEFAMSKSNVNASAIVTANLDTFNEETGEHSTEPKSKWSVEILQKMLDFSLLKSPTFLLLAISGFITILGFPVPFIYLKSLALSNQINAGKATLLVSIIGITNTIGRIVCGGIADSPKSNSLVINNAALTIGGLATAVAPFIGSTAGFPGYVVYSCVFGFCMACFASLRSILLVELLGLNKLTNAFGLLMLFSGGAAMCGSPLAGSLFDITGNFNLSFYVAGGLLMLSGIMCFPLNSVNNWETERNKLLEEMKDENI